MTFDKKFIYRVLFVVSVVANVILGGSALINKFNFPLDRSGVLTKNIKIGNFGDKQTIFTLPKGLTVQDATPRGFAAIDLFEPYRFTITVTTEDMKLVDYDYKRMKHEFGSLYSADITTTK
jgi:hypothetical protein